MKIRTITTQMFSPQNSCASLLLALLTLTMFPSSARETDQVPFKGIATGAITSFEPGPAGVTITVQTEGYATQLGRFTREETLLLNPATMTFTGTIVFTAANGDELLVGVAGAFTSPTTAAGTYTFNGGTGRFANAAGSAVFAASTDGDLVSVEFTGAISPVGANLLSL